MSKRLEMLQAMSQKSADPFASYALAMEYAKLSRFDEAVQTFAALRSREPEYLPMYLIAAQLLLQLAQVDTARDWLLAGIDLATRKMDAKALSELKSALAAASD